jgi:hypothetical protein
MLQAQLAPRAGLPHACFRPRGARVHRARAAPTCAVVADRKFRSPGEADVHLFGVEHVSETRREVGDGILELRPFSVVVETACTIEHGAAHGTRLTINELNEGGEDWCGIAACDCCAKELTHLRLAGGPDVRWPQAQDDGERRAVHQA